MVCTATELLDWGDFPKGLKVLLLDEDSCSAAEIRAKLEKMNYIVSAFRNENDALIAISNKPESFHIAIVEVSSENSHGRFKFLEVAKDLPTIMTSKKQCLATMMKCIALGAVEFLQKPLSDDKLRNIWQHVVHKAFNAEGQDLIESQIKESVVSMLNPLLENGEPEISISVETECEPAIQENGQEHSAGSDKYPAPPTPQLKQGFRLVDYGDCQDQTNCSTDKVSGDQDGESKSVDATCGNLLAETIVRESPQILGETVTKEDDDAPHRCKSESDVCLLQKKDGPSDTGGEAGNPMKASGPNKCANRTNRKKMKVDWTPELHKKFVQAVEKLGVDQAIPSRILESMKVEGLTRHNIASHLQKYRMQRRHILPKGEERTWPLLRDPSKRSYYPHKPVMAFPPPFHSNPNLPSGPVYPAWGYPGSYASGVHMWSPALYPPWQPTESWHSRPYSGMHAADAWGCPVMPPPHGPWPSQDGNRSFYANSMHSRNSMPQNSIDLYPAEEFIDKVVKEAISKPSLPLPIGLKPPSTDSVLSELSKQGISIIPFHIKGSRSR